MMVEHDVIVPGNTVMIGENKFRLRYITKWDFQYRYHFQPAVEPLNPLVENDVLIISVNVGQSLKFEVIPQ